MVELGYCINLAQLAVIDKLLIKPAMRGKNKAAFYLLAASFFSVWIGVILGDRAQLNAE